jgi:ABC-type transport system substrate-binding protein
MGGVLGRVTRVSAIVAVLLTIAMLGTSFQLGNKSVNLSPVDEAAAANGSRVYTIGEVDYGGGMATLNPFLYTQAEEMQTVWPVYSTLIQYTLDLNYVGDLANSWTVSPDGTTWDFKLVRNAYFVDPLNPTVKNPARLVTAKDVIWTYWEINNNTLNHLNYYLSNGFEGVIQNMHQGADQFEVIIQTKWPYAPFLGALAALPIVPEYIWGHLPGGTKPMNYDNLPMVGSGPFYSTMTAVPQTLGILHRNPIWFQEENRGWQIHIDTLQFKTELNPVTAWTELTMASPVIDTMLQVTPSLYRANIINSTTPGVIGWGVETGFVFEYQLNQMNDVERYWLEKAGKVTRGGSNNQLLLDPTVKLALAMSVDKQEFIDQAYLGLGTPADSVVPGISRWHYTYPNPVQFNPTAARQLLMNAGWAWDSYGNPATSTTAPLYKKGAVNNTVYHPLSFNLISLTPETWWDIGSRLIVEWARDAGVEYTRELMSTNQANSLWYKADYDAWLWDWALSPTSDPSTDCLSMNTVGAIGSWSGSYWANATYDELYNRSIREVDPTARKVITDQMQAMLYEDHAAQYPAYRQELYAASYVKWDKDSYGNWKKNYLLMPDWATPYLWMQLSPVDNLAPKVTVPATFEGVVGSPVNFFGSATDSSSLKYQWYWGDESASSGWLTSASKQHTFANDGVYTVYFAAQEQGTADGYVSWNKTQVTVINPANAPPKNVQITKSPTTGINTGTIVTFTGTATDADPLYYTWNFGDGFTGIGQVVTHQFKSPGSWTVTLNVTDNHPGTGRPAQATMLVSVTANGPPTVSLPSTKLVQVKIATAFNATASDPDGDPLRFTWIWGDGKTSVTTVPTATHTYAQKSPGILMKVYADDLTTLSGHNKSASCTVTVTGAASVPVITSFTVNNLTTGISALQGQPLWFTGSAKDSGGDAMTFQFKFGDGVWYNVTTDPAPPANQIATFSVAHPYSNSGTYTAYLYVTDGQDTKTSPSRIVTVTPVNQPPIVQDLNPISAPLGGTVSVSATAFDPDGDVLKYTWNFGDSTPLVVGQSVTHVYHAAGVFTYAVWVDDGHGHNVSQDSTATVTAGYGLLRVTTNPAVPSMIYIDGQWASPWGLNWVKLTPGMHELSFSDVPGMVKPATTAVEILDGQTTSYQAVFTPCGSLRVITSPAVPSTIFVNGIPRNDWGIWVDVPAGTYTVSFGAVKDYATPSPQTVTLTSGGYQEVTGVFTSSPGSPGPDPATYGMLRLTTNPAVSSMIYIDGQWASPWGLNWVKLSPGTHTLHWSDVPGWITPADQQFTITAGQTTTIDKAWTHCGSLRVISSPAVPSTVYVNGIPRNDWGMWADIPPGTYTVTFGAVPGYTTPVGQTVTLTAGGYQEVTGVFTPI